MPAEPTVLLVLKQNRMNKSAPTIEVDVVVVAVVPNVQVLSQGFSSSALFLCLLYVVCDHVRRLGRRRLRTTTMPGYGAL